MKNTIRHDAHSSANAHNGGHEKAKKASIAVSALTAAVLSGQSAEAAPAVEMGGTYIGNEWIPTLSIATENKNVPAKVVAAKDGDKSYVAGKLGLAGEKVYTALGAGYAQEGDLHGKKFGGSVGYVTDMGSNIGVRGSHTRVNGVDYGTNLTRSTTSNTDSNTTSEVIGTREDVINSYEQVQGNVKNTINVIQATDTIRDTTVNTTTTTHYETSVHTGRHGSKTNAVGVFAEMNAGRTRPAVAVDYTDRKYDDGSHEKYTTGTIGVRHYGDKGSVSAEVSKNFGDKKNTGYNVRGDYQFSDNVSGFVSGGKSTEIGNNVMAGVKWVWGGKHQTPAAPTTASDYANQIVDNTVVTDAPANLVDQTKYFKDVKNTSSQIITTDTQIADHDVVKGTREVLAKSEVIKTYEPATITVTPGKTITDIGDNAYLTNGHSLNNSVERLDGTSVPFYAFGTIWSDNKQIVAEQATDVVVNNNENVVAWQLIAYFTVGDWSSPKVLASGTGPVPVDANNHPVIYGAHLKGAYKDMEGAKGYLTLQTQQKDAQGNTILDANGNPYWIESGLKQNFDY